MMGPWQTRVQWLGSTAFHPGVVLFRSHVEDRALATLEEARLRREEGEDADEERRIVGDRFRVTRVTDPLRAVSALAREGIVAQLDHVLFATCWCPPHPAACRREPPSREDVPSPEQVKESTLGGAPVHGNPVHGNPVHGNPVHGNAGGGCCCGGVLGFPVHGNPVHGNPVHGNPVHGNAEPNPTGQVTGRRRSTVRPVPAPPARDPARKAAGVRIAVLDTGWSDPDYAPQGFAAAPGSDDDDLPTEDGDAYLDPTAGHGTFIGGILAQEAAGSIVEHVAVLSTYGDGRETDIADQLWELSRRTDETRPQIVNMSFGGYTTGVMFALWDAVAALARPTEGDDRAVVLVASAGNDATCAPMYPAALPDVVGVAALDDEGHPASFTNYGPWVRACAPGVDVVSCFFDGFDGAEAAQGGGDIDRFHGWAIWSGTSFAAPRVAAAIARRIADGADGPTAVQELVDQGPEHRHLLGTVVGAPAKT